ncbi:hypothetical protein GA0061094_4050 [[Bacillus] enclensis]|uniref:Uncharacterized protein n=1 Tax=[Bacillus] enclensis TaxID=1402860 RepID=A0A1C4DPL6_9BACI|nr:hypothetical protein [[Bacillus] enclensis]SCC33309.1 hypothetical protein GA0061094_4050 [[Bacillus] enclensis]
MRIFVYFLIGLFLFSNPDLAGKKIRGYDIVSQDKNENITLYGKKTNGLYRGFKIDFKGEIYTKPFWISEISPSFPPQIFYSDINTDEKEELAITLTKGHGTGVLIEDVHVFHTIDNGLCEVIVDNPLAIINKSVKTKLSNQEAEIQIEKRKYKVDLLLFGVNPENLFEDISFGSIIDYEVMNHNLMVKVTGQISPAMFIGDIIITYEYLAKLYQAKSIEFITDIDKNPFYGPVTQEEIFNPGKNKERTTHFRFL